MQLLTIKFQNLEGGDEVIVSDDVFGLYAREVITALSEEFGQLAVFLT